MQELPETIGPCRILGLLGRGGAGSVYRARHEHSGEMVALKTLPVPSEAYLPTLRREIHALSRLHHPGIVRILENGTHRGMPWLAMELIEGSSLRDYCGKDGAEETAARRDLPLQLILSVVRRLCAALGYMHGEGLIHRDLKPENILIKGRREWAVGSSNGKDAAPPGAYSLLPTPFPVLVDFGLASEFSGPESSRESLRLDGVGSGTRRGVLRLTSGATREQMATTLALLAKDGAFAGSQVQMHLHNRHWRAASITAVRLPLPSLPRWTGSGRQLLRCETHCARVPFIPWPLMGPVAVLAPRDPVAPAPRAMRREAPPRESSGKHAFRGGTR